MAGRGIPPEVLAELFPPLAGWLRSLDLDTKAGLANYFTEVELGSGEAALTLSGVLGVDSEGDFVRLAQDLDAVVAFARRQAALRRRGFAALEEHTFYYERVLRQRGESFQAELARVREHDVARERAALPALRLRPRQGHRPRRLPAPPGDGRLRSDEEESRRGAWLGRIRRILHELDAPILQLVAGSRQPEQLLSSHLAGKRANTLAARVRAWDRYRLWLRSTYGVGHHAQPHHLLDYLLDRRSEPCSRGTLSAVLAMQRFADEVMGLPESQRWTADAGVMALARGIIADARPSASSRVTGPAHMPLVGILARLEEVVCDDDATRVHRLLAWWMCLSSWSG